MIRHFQYHQKIDHHRYYGWEKCFYYNSYRSLEDENLLKSTALQSTPNLFHTYTLEASISPDRLSNVSCGGLDDNVYSFYDTFKGEFFVTFSQIKPDSLF
jgi:hypothetical protein